MKILVVDGYHDSDRGGAGIIVGLMDTLRQVAQSEGVPIDVGLVYRFSEDDPKYQTAARHTKKAFPEVTIYGTPISTIRNKDRGWISRPIKSLEKLIRALLKWISPRLFSDKVIAAIQDADVVISKGGHFYYSFHHNSIVGLIQSFYSYHNLLLAIRLKKKLALVGHSFGPFNNHGSQWLTRYICKHADFVGAREVLSKQKLTGIGVPESRVAVIPDSAFALTPAPFEDVVGYLKRFDLQPKAYAVITAIPWHFGKPNVQEIDALNEVYRAAMANVADVILDEGLAKKVLLVAHNKGFDEVTQGDAPSMRSIFGKMRRKDAAIIIEDDLSPRMQSGIYGQAAFIVGTRMHSVIFAIVGGGSAVAVSYTHKTTGIMKMLELDEYVLPVDSIDVNVARDMIRKLMAEKDAVMDRTSSKVEECRTLLQATLKNIMLNGRAT